MTRGTPDERTSGGRNLFKRGLHWPIMVAVVFAGNIALATWVIIVANSDPSFAIEENYYEKALNWNDEIDQRRRNQALAWSVEIADPPTIDTTRRCTLALRVADASDDPLSGARVDMEAFPIARANQKRALALDETAPGRYETRVEDARAGPWELRVRVEHDSDIFTQRLNVLIDGAN